jgi:hypothetical protein
MQPRPISISSRYWSGSRLRAWGRVKLGDRFTVERLAVVLGWSATATRYALRDQTSPTLENYCSAVARVGERLGVWLEHVDADRES